MAVRGHLRLKEAGKPQAQAFWKPEEREPLLCNPFSTTPKQEARRCPFWQPLSSGLWEVWFVGSVSVSEFTSTGLEERNQLVLAAWAIRVCVGGRLQATWGTQVSLRLQPPPRPRLGGVPGSQTPATKHKWWLHKRYSPRWWHPMGLKSDCQG